MVRFFILKKYLKFLEQFIYNKNKNNQKPVKQDNKCGIGIVFFGGILEGETGSETKRRGQDEKVG